MAADRPYGELYDFYNVSPEYFAYTLVPAADVDKLKNPMEACLRKSLREVQPWVLQELYTLNL
jgi:hypothetical protein